MSVITNNKLVYEPINDDYEWIQYNKQLRIIHSIKDDMYQIQSIINACDSIKQAKNWFANQSTKELLCEFEVEKGFRGIPRNEKSYENRRNLPNNIKGYYIHRLLVNAVAMWASPRYSLRIFKLLDEIASDDRNRLIQTIEQQYTTINDQHQTIEQQSTTIHEQRPRLVPKHKEHNYSYMIWKEEVEDEPDMILLHLVKRNNRTFRQVRHHLNNNEEKWFYRDNLPIAMTPNEDIKDLVRQSLPKSEYDIDGSTIMTYKEHLSKLYELIDDYFNDFQE